MAEDAVKTDTAQTATEVKRCEMCSGLFGDEDHQKEGECGFYQRLKELVVAKNGGVTVWA